MHSSNEKTLTERIEQRRQARTLPRFIAVEGPIGAGKTSLAKRLAMTFGYDLLLEQADDNPFLTRFYQDPARYALQTELFFLFQRADQLRQIQQQDLFAGPRIADFLIDKNRLFAQVTLDEDEFELYRNVDDHLTLDAPQPDLVIYLQAPPRCCVSVSAVAATISSKASRAITWTGSAMPTRNSSISTTGHRC